MNGSWSAPTMKPEEEAEAQAAYEERIKKWGHLLKAEKDFDVTENNHLCMPRRPSIKKWTGPSVRLRSVPAHIRMMYNNGIRLSYFAYRDLN